MAFAAQTHEVVRVIDLGIFPGQDVMYRPMRGAADNARVVVSITDEATDRVPSIAAGRQFSALPVGIGGAELTIHLIPLS